jgi:RimJ/RimL family protein N-acetyltransferase
MKKAKARLNLETERLRLRTLRLGDVSVVARLAGRPEIADTTLSIPHPYSVQQARDWIRQHSEGQTGGKEMVFAIFTKNEPALVGTIGLKDIDREHRQAEMGFWIGVEFWGRGYATEAAALVLRFAFEQIKLNRVCAHYMVRNPASGRVLQKVGMKREGLLRQRVRKWEVFEDVVLMAILHEDWLRMTP